MNSLYVYRPVLNAERLHNWAQARGIKNLVPPEQMHVTQVYSRNSVEDLTPRDDILIVKRKIEPLGNKGALVLSFPSDALQARHVQAIAAGASHDFEGYHPHVTLSYDAGDQDWSKLAPPDFPLELGPEVFQPLNENWATDMGLRKDITASGVHTPTALGNEDEEEAMSTTTTPVNPNFRVAKVDKSLGLVFGWAVVCKVKGEDYYDLNVDLAGQHAGKRVPEHIPEDVMTKAALDITKNGYAPGNEMHEGPDRGHYPFLFPLTTDIAKAMGIITEKTGLMCAFAPPADVLTKFQPGPNGEPPEYTGFSIEGKRLAYEEID